MNQDSEGTEVKKERERKIREKYRSIYNAIKLIE